MDTAPTLRPGSCPKCGHGNPASGKFCNSCGGSLLGLASEEPTADPLIGRTIANRYRIVELLGKGGMGVVYKAEHIHIGKFMALKLLHGELINQPATVSRFQREAEAASQLSHHNTVQVFDFGRSDGIMYLVMEYVEGRDLGELIRENERIDFKEVARLGAQVCASLSEAHDLGIIHRDLKPENVMILENTSGGTAKVLDFGLAKILEDTSSVTLTRAGAIVGTPYYMSPEQIRGEAVDQRGDLYSIGAMLYKAVAGVPPYWAPTPMGVLTKHLTDAFVPPSERVDVPIPPEADRIIARAMQKDPEDRYQSANELRDALNAYLESVGERAPSSKTSMSASSRVRVLPQFATRKDVDTYERRIRARGAVTKMLGALVLCGLGAAGFFYYKHLHKDPKPSPTEVEPNNDVSQATWLPPDHDMTAHLGQRLEAELGDSDIYLIKNRKEGIISVDVTAVPNMNIVVELARKGSPNPVLRADSFGPGHGEAIPNFPLKASDYYLRIREKRFEGVLPTENISDSYKVRWKLVTRAETDEIELNDSLELAESVRLGESKTGWIGWADDVDTYCLGEDVEKATASVTGVQGVDIILRSADRQKHRSRKIDKNGIGEAEETNVVDAHAGNTCFEISADENELHAERANAVTPYTFIVEAK